MTERKSRQDRLDKVVAEARRTRELRDQSYREQALKLFPWVCGRCRREFTRANLAELTVHHRDHNHDYNPPDGSNWELLCLYCHDAEHAHHDAGGAVPGGGRDARGTYRPFSALGSLLKNGK